MIFTANAVVMEKNLMQQLVLESQNLQHQLITYRRLPIEVTSIYVEGREIKPFSKQPNSYSEIRIQKILDYAIRHSSRTGTEKEADFKLFFKVRLRRSPV